jgi:molybdenum cofactor cytidylyltransferase
MVSGILLGAGESKRMGRNKLFLPWGRETVLEHCLKTLLHSKVKEVIVVLNNRMKGRVKDIKENKLKIVTNPYYKRGMSTSIRRGLQAIDINSRGVLIALGDQPLIKTRTINALIHAFVQRKGAIVIPSFRGRQGHPVVFHRRYLKELLKLKGDVGGRSIIEKHPEDVWFVRVKSESVTKDIDTWKDYHKELRVNTDVT